MPKKKPADLTGALLATKGAAAPAAATPAEPETLPEMTVRTKKLTVKVPMPEYRALRTHCLDFDTTGQDVMMRALRAYLVGKGYSFED
jgi:hypothetical protein